LNNPFQLFGCIIVESLTSENAENADISVSRMMVFGSGLG
jgi:hypothetical protein